MRFRFRNIVPQYMACFPLSHFGIAVRNRNRIRGDETRYAAFKSHCVSVFGGNRYNNFLIVTRFAHFNPVHINRGIFFSVSTESQIFDIIRCRVKRGGNVKYCPRRKILVDRLRGRCFICGIRSGNSRYSVVFNGKIFHSIT